MRVEKVNLYCINQAYSNNNNNAKSSQIGFSNYETSIYNQKGVAIPFGCIAKGIDEAENICISMLRKLREPKLHGGRGANPRKFAEDEIKEIITSLRVVKRPEEKTHILQEVLAVRDENTDLLPENKVIKQLVKLIAGKPESERYALLEFAQNDIKTEVIEPIIAFTKLPQEKQNKLIEILGEINEVNEPALYKSGKAHTEAVDSLYDLVRVPVYAEDDIQKIADKNEVSKYKIEAIDLINHDTKYLNSRNIYSDEAAKSKVMTVTRKVFDYFLDNVL